MLFTNRIHTIAYHPITNGIVERFHRHLKSSIKAYENAQWTDILPIGLLGIHTTVKGDIKASCLNCCTEQPSNFLVICWKHLFFHYAMTSLMIVFETQCAR
ncbi:retrovirus-related Pol polyprotein from transposon 412 [Nephila pilipes]|uniref:Retrovirus-related Pol polyprotein from transposon 412 n=1 Tax=Nephila pilipes TaxID=299642 RepID=A0A8X6PD03_NEPPI|nr:retrovirus-related Pol polyprotein from transposon 412 [Nephila pilipes]